jgi:hypothetical protein
MLGFIMSMPQSQWVRLSALAQSQKNVPPTPRRSKDMICLSYLGADGIDNPLQIYPALKDRAHTHYLGLYSILHFHRVAI